MNIPKSVIRDWVKNLDGRCLFHACEGSRNPPLDMITCVICYSVWEMKQYLSGLTFKQIEQKRIQYQKEFDNKTNETVAVKEKDNPNKMKKYTYLVQHFSYNGFTGKLLKGMTTYSAKFKSWTRDPGIARFECSDNTERLIPTFALKGLKHHPLSEQDMSNKIIIGPPSHS
jgi:hypothetical protein